MLRRVSPGGISAPKSSAASAREGMRLPRYSILDLAPVRAGGTIAEAYRNTVDLARRAERWGFTRFWLA